jgi:hypothetical protein
MVIGLQAYLPKAPLFLSSRHHQIIKKETNIKPKLLLHENVMWSHSGGYSKIGTYFIFKLTALQTEWCGKASCHGAIFTCVAIELAFPIEYTATYNPKCETRTSGYLS